MVLKVNQFNLDSQVKELRANKFVKKASRNLSSLKKEIKMRKTKRSTKRSRKRKNCKIIWCHKAVSRTVCLYF